MAYISMAIVLSVELLFTCMVSAASFTPLGLAATLLIFFTGLTSAEFGLYIVRNPLRSFGDMLNSRLRQVGNLLELIYTFVLIAAPIVAMVWCCLVYMPGALEPVFEQPKSALSEAISIGGGITVAMGIGGWLGAPIRFGSFRRLFNQFRYR